MTNYTKGADALDLLTRLKEIDLDRMRIPELGEAVFRGRELKATARFEVLQAAAGINGSVNVPLWRILAATRGVIDPETGELLFQGDAVGRLIESGNVIAEKMGSEILDLSEATPESLKSGSDSRDARQSDAADGAGDIEQES